MRVAHRAAIATATIVFFASVLGFAGQPSGLYGQQPDSIDRQPVQYRNGPVTIAATLARPAAATRPAVGVVIAHGSGPSARDNPWTSAYADALARRGISVLYPDKRGSGESTGDWRDASVHDLAGDVIAGIEFLRKQFGSDSATIGVIGFSQGGYVASVVAVDHPGSAFTAVISGGTAPLRDQIVDEISLEAARRDQPLSDGDMATVRDLYGRLFMFAQHRRGWTTYIEGVAAATAAGGALAYAVRTLPDDSTHWVMRFLRQMGDFDPMPYWNRVQHPVVFVYGGRDTQVRPDESIARLRSAESREHITTMLFGGNGHTLFREDVMAFLAAWIHNRGRS